MFEYKYLLGYASIAVAMVGYIPYLKDILAGKTKPHAFSWFIWFVVEGIAFTVQWLEHGGAGGWVHGIQAGLCLVVFVLALRYGHSGITRFDWWSLTIALISIVLWWYTHQAMIAVLLSILIEVMAFAPTFRKSFRLPHQETTTLYFTSAISYALGLLALEQYQLVNWLYQAVLVCLNGILIIWLLLLRRSRVKIVL